MERGACGSSNLETVLPKKNQLKQLFIGKKGFTIIKRGVQCQTAARKIGNMPL
jgi:hypothetical protein